jgi:hypothetical protein
LITQTRVVNGDFVPPSFKSVTEFLIDAIQLGIVTQFLVLRIFCVLFGTTHSIKTRHG